MRNWNSNIPKGKEQEFRDLSYLWGIETSISLPWYFAQYIGFILPMRNWNNDLHLSPSSKYPDLSYLWGIETFKRFLTCFLPNRIYLTYEELKPDKGCGSAFHVLLDLSYLWGIETKFSAGSGLALKGIYLTYEELKPMRSPEICFGSAGFILPMRNWNSRPTSRLKTCTEDLSYLWGIETEKGGLPVGRKPRIYLTYEELKHGS